MEPSTGFTYGTLPPELLQVVGDRLSPPELRAARLACKAWATSLAHCMPAVTVALPRQASERIFRQPLVLCSSGVLNSAQCQDYSAVPHGSSSGGGAGGSVRRASTAHATCFAPAAAIAVAAAAAVEASDASLTADSCVAATTTAQPPHSARSMARSRSAAAPSCKAAGDDDGLQQLPPTAVLGSNSRDKPSPFATELGQAVLSALEDPVMGGMGAAAAGPAGLKAKAQPGLPRPFRAIQGAISLPPPLLPHKALMLPLQQQAPPPPSPAQQQQHELAHEDHHHQQQQQLEAAQQQAAMRKLSSVPASNVNVPQMRHISRDGSGAGQRPAAAAQPEHVVTAALGPAIQGWSSLPSAGLRTCSSLQQLHLKLSGAPPRPEDLLDLSRLAHLTHLSLKQVDLPDDAEEEAAAAEADADTSCSADDSGGSSIMICSRSSSGADALGACEAVAPAAAAQLRGSTASRRQLHDDDEDDEEDALAQVTAAALGRMSMDFERRGSSSSGSSPRSADTARTAPACAAVAGGSSPRGASRLRFSSSTPPPQKEQEQQALAACQPDEWLCDGPGVYKRRAAGKAVGSTNKGAGGPQQPHTSDTALPGDQAAQRPAAAAGAPAAASDGGEARSTTVSSVITAEHVLALAKLPHLSSLELAPRAGVWDAAGCEGLLQLSCLTALTRLSITWGDAAAAAAAGKPLGTVDAVAAARGAQLPLQRCLASLPQLQELVVNGAAVVDVCVLQAMQQLRRLTGEGLQVVDADLAPLLKQLQQQQQAAAAGGGCGEQQGLGTAATLQQHMPAAAAPVAALPLQQGLPLLGELAPVVGAGAEPQHAPAQQQRRWVALPALEYVHVVHPAADISYLLQATVTPQLAHLGFVTRGPSDFARLLGQHGKLRVLHLVFAEEESWHPIAVVRLPTALPSLRSLTLEGAFWLPNSLIVALGVMEVPLEHLSLTCRLAPPCLARLQHLKRLKRLALHHTPGGPAWPPPPQAVTGGRSRSGRRSGGGKAAPCLGDGMLQLPAKLLPPQLQELEISNGWIQH